MWSNEKKTREIKIIVPIKRFEKLPDVIDYSFLPYGRIEKAHRLLMRSMHSAIDNKENRKTNKEITQNIRDKRRNRANCYNTLNVLIRQLAALKDVVAIEGVKIEGCSIIKKQRDDLKKEIKHLDIEIELLKKNYLNLWILRVIIGGDGND